MNEAVICFNKEESRFELYIEGVLKAYSKEPNPIGKKELERIVTEKGYDVRYE